MDSQSTSLDGELSHQPPHAYTHGSNVVAELIELSKELSEQLHALQEERHEFRVMMKEMHELQTMLKSRATPSKANEEPELKTRAKSKSAPDWDKLDEWLPLKDAALKAARMSQSEFRTWAKAQRIRTRPFGKRRRYHRDDIRGYAP